ncbi:hypothetical protein [Arcanobacterium phocae]|uniref:hypothetical protein n=1 Tax=Arcanobacterium phocae TaxID=131112 RepID=UPI001C0F34CF|nr:hypothetical protein [Arcanobacterium phocae]
MSATTYSLSSSVFGFETLKGVLGVGSNTAAKIIDLNLISVFDDRANPRNQRYSGWDIEYLATARNRPFLIPSGTRALVCSMGVEEREDRPSLYLDATWGEREQDLQEIEKELKDPVMWNQIRAGKLRVTGHWRVSQDDTNYLTNNHGIIVASYAGFILDGGRIKKQIPNMLSKSGGRCFVVKPFSPRERFRYAHNYLASRPGPMNKVWTAEGLFQEVADSFVDAYQDEYNITPAIQQKLGIVPGSSLDSLQD